MICGDSLIGATVTSVEYDSEDDELINGMRLLLTNGKKVGIGVSYVWGEGERLEVYYDKEDVNDN